MLALRKVLLVSANPKGAAPIRIDAEMKVIREALKGSPISCELLLSATIQDLQHALLEQPYQLVHISSHGTASGSLELDDAMGERYAVPQAALANEFNAYRAALQCVVLNACYSAAQGKLTSVGVATTIAMEGELGDSASIEFSRAFYRALAAGHDVAFAYDRGCSAVALAAPGTAFMPVKLENPRRRVRSLASSSGITVQVHLLDIGQRHTLCASPDLSVGALSTQAQLTLGAAAPGMQWALIDGQLKEQWRVLSVPEQQRLWALVKTAEGVVPSYSGDDTLDDLGVSDGMVFFLVGRQNAVLSSGLSAGTTTVDDVKQEEVARRLDDYRQRVHAEYSDIRLDLTDETLRLDDSYIRLAVARPVAKTKDAEQEHSRAELLQPEAASAKYRALWIEGEPGAGKTTLLYYLMRRLSAPDAGTLVPVYLSSKTLARANGGLAEAIRSSPAACAPSDAPAWKFVVLVDGMDEVQPVAPPLDYLNPLMLPRNVRVVVTSRPVMQPPAPSAWVKMQIQPLSEDVITAFLRDRSVDGLAEQLPEEVRTGGILSVPLFLHIAAKTVSRLAGRGRLTRVSLLGQLLEYVEEREAMRGRATGAGERAQLQSLAWEMRVAGATTSFDLRLAARAGLSADDVARVVRSGLVRKEGTNYTFAHLLVAEYLAAAHLASQPAGAFPAIVWRSWAPLFSTEVLPLACALWPDLGGFLQQVALQMPETAQQGRLRLLGRCLRERPETIGESAFARRVRAVVQATAANILMTKHAGLFTLPHDVVELASFVGEPLLLDMLDDPDTRTMAVCALGQLKASTALDRLSAMAGLVRHPVDLFEAMESIRPGAAFKTLVAQADDSDPDVRERTARMLGFFWHPQNVETLLQLFDDLDPAVRKSAIEQTIRPEVGDHERRFRSALVGKLRDDDRGVRLSAADALAQHDQPEHAPSLFALLLDPSSDIREAGVRAIGRKTGHHDPSPRAMAAALPYMDENADRWFDFEIGSWARDPAILVSVMASVPQVFARAEEKGGGVFPSPIPTFEPWKWSLFPASFALDDVAGVTMSFSYDDHARLDIRVGEHRLGDGGVIEAPELNLSPATLRVFSDIAVASVSDRWRSEPGRWLESVAPELGPGLAQLAEGDLEHVYNFALSGLYLMGLGRPGDRSLLAQYAASLGTQLQRSQTQLEQLVVRAWLMTCLSAVVNTDDPWPMLGRIMEKVDDGDAVKTAFATFGAPALQAVRRSDSSSVLHRVPFATWLRIVRVTAMDPPRQDKKREATIFVVKGVAPVAVARPVDIWSGCQTGCVPGALKIALIPNSPAGRVPAAFLQALEVVRATVRNDYFDSWSVHGAPHVLATPEEIFGPTAADTPAPRVNPEAAKAGMGNMVRRLFGFGRSRN